MFVEFDVLSGPLTIGFPGILLVAGVLSRRPKGRRRRTVTPWQIRIHYPP